MTFAEAQAAAREHVSRYNRLDPGIEYEKRSVHDLVARWKEDVADSVRKESTRRSYLWAFSRIEAALGSRKVSEIGRADVQAFLAKQGRKLSPHSVHDLRARLQGLLTIAEEWGWIPPGSNPARGKLRLPARERVREPRVLEPADFVRLKNELRPPYGLLVMLAVLSGLRKGELAALRWNDLSPGSVRVDEAVYEGVLGSPKTRKSRRAAAIGAGVWEAVEEWRKKARFVGPDDFVFALKRNRPGDLKNAMNRHVRPACRTLGIPPVGWHDLRHTHITWGRKAGILPEAMREQVGHESVLTTLDIYSKADGRDGLAAAMERYSGILLLDPVTSPRVTH